MSALEALKKLRGKSSLTDIEYTIVDYGVWVEHWDMANKAAAELEQLRAEVAQLKQAVSEAANILATVSLEAYSVNGNNLLRMKKYVRDECDAWLDAHPAPEQTTELI